MFIPRTVSTTLREAVRGYPVLSVTGPRQSGKSTLVRAEFPELPYVSLEDPDQLDLATTDPRRFLARFPEGAILDEVQRAPDLFSYLQGVVDQAPRTGPFVLTGSQQFGLHARITQSLAGRVALIVLLPFSWGELRAAGRTPATLEELLFTGMYPPIYDRDLEPSFWYRNYIETYIERDVRQMVNIRDLGVFRTFLRMCAARCGQLVNLSNLGSDCGLSYNTVRAWLSVLESSYLVHLLPPHHRNFSKRLIKSGKIYFLDPGLAAYLVGIRDARELETHPMRGPLFEAWVLSELLKGRYHRGRSSNLYFWRDRAGMEVDFIADLGGSLVPIEAKSGRTVVAEFLSTLGRWRSLAGSEAAPGWLVHGGSDRQEREGVRVLPWKEIDALIEAT